MDKSKRTPSKERGCITKINLGGSNYKENADRMAKKHGKMYGVYRCPHCGGTHLTTKLEGMYRYGPMLYITGREVEG